MLGSGGFWLNPIRNRLINLEEKYVYTTRFIEITSGTSGTVTLPDDSEVILDPWGGDADAIISGLDTSSRPNFEAVYSATGALVTTSFDSVSTDGDYVLSDTPSSYPVALVYRVKQMMKDFDSESSDIVGDVAFEGIRVGAFAATSTPNGMSVLGDTITLHPADATNPGAITAERFREFADASNTGLVSWDNEKLEPMWSFDSTVSDEFNVLQGGLVRFSGVETPFLLDSPSVTPMQTLSIGVQRITGELEAAPPPPDAKAIDHVSLFRIYWDGTTKHIVVRSGHRYNRELGNNRIFNGNEGTVFKNGVFSVSRMGGTGGTSNDDRTLVVENADVINAQGIETSTGSQGAALFVHSVYLDPRYGWTIDEQDYPLPMKYYRAGITPIPTDYFGYYSLYALNDSGNSTTDQYLAIMGDTVDSKIESVYNAINSAPVLATGEMLALEPAFVGFVIVQNTHVGYIYEIINNPAMSFAKRVSQGFTANAKTVRVDASSFGGVLKSSDTDVQKLADSLDFHAHASYLTGSALTNQLAYWTGTKAVGGNTSFIINPSVGVGFMNNSPQYAVDVGNVGIGNSVRINSTEGVTIAPDFAAGSWTCTNGWSASGTTLEKVTNATAGTATPSGVGATPTVGVTYKISITLSAKGSAAVTYSYGGVTGTALSVGTTTEYICAQTTGKLIITGAVSSTATVTAISIQPISVGSLRDNGDILLAGEIKSPSGLGGISIDPLGSAHIRGTAYFTGSISATAGTGAFGAITNTGSQTSNLATLFVPTDGHLLQPAAQPTGVTSALIPTQYSPNLSFRAYAWDIDGSSQYQNFRQWVEPYVAIAGASVNGRLKWENARTSTAQTDNYELMNLCNAGCLNVLGTTLGTECLTNPDLTSGTSWTVANGCSLASDKMTYSHHASGGTFKQTQANLAVALKANTWYRFTYTTSAPTITVRGYIDETVTSQERIYLPGITPAAGIGTFSVTFMTNASPTDFQITFTSAVGSITFDTLSLKEITDGHITSTGKVRANDKFNVAGTDGISGTYNIDGTTAGTVATITITGGIITGVTTR